jgi:hypothetical protein
MSLIEEINEFPLEIVITISNGVGDTSIRARGTMENTYDLVASMPPDASFLEKACSFGITLVMRCDYGKYVLPIVTTYVKPESIKKMADIARLPKTHFSSDTPSENFFWDKIMQPEYENYVILIRDPGPPRMQCKATYAVVPSSDEFFDPSMFGAVTIGFNREKEDGPVVIDRIQCCFGATALRKSC